MKCVLQVDQVVDHLHSLGKLCLIPVAAGYVHKKNPRAVMCEELRHQGWAGTVSLQRRPDLLNHEPLVCEERGHNLQPNRVAASLNFPDARKIPRATLLWPTNNLLTLRSQHFLRPIQIRGRASYVRI